MSTLRITVAHATEDTRTRAVDALADAGITVHRADLDAAADSASSAPGPSGPLMWATLVLAAAMVALLLAWVWAGDARYGATAGILLPVTLVTFVASFGGRR